MAAIPAAIAASRIYKHGWKTDIQTSHPFGLGITEDTVRGISKRREEPEWLTEFRVGSFKRWLKMKPPKWSKIEQPTIDFSKIAFFSEPKTKKKVKSINDVDPKLLDTFQKLGIPVDEQKRLANVATDVVFDSTSVVTTFRKALSDVGITFCSIREAVKSHPELVKKHLGSVVPKSDNYWAALNSAVFTDGSFVHIPKGVTAPMELSTYFRINDKEAGQFERTLIVAEPDSKVSYLEGCTAPAFDSKQLHAAVVELVAQDDAKIDYSTVQNWYPGDINTGVGGVLNYVTKRGVCHDRASIRWSQVEVGSAATWKYPSCILKGDGSSGEFYSVSLTNGKMQADTGTKMIHIGNNSRSHIVSKSISSDGSKNTFRGLIHKSPLAKNVRSFSQCDSMLVGDNSVTNTIPIIKTSGPPPHLEHEASVSKLDAEQLQFLRTRGLDEEQSIRLIIGGFCDKVVKKLPQEFASEATALLGMKLVGSVG